jgi:hypothetical protein
MVTPILRVRASFPRQMTRTTGQGAEETFWMRRSFAI